MRNTYASPDTLTNDVRLRGFLTEDASLFVVSPSGQAHLKLRLEVWLDERARRLPPKQPADVNFISVVSSQPEHVALLSQLQRGREVLVRGLLQSRDIQRPGHRRAARRHRSGGAGDHPAADHPHRRADRTPRNEEAP